MKTKGKNIKSNSSQSDKSEEYPDYPLYPPSEDIYNKYKEEDIDPELNLKDPSSLHLNEKDIIEDLTGSDLDVPGSEMDDEQEIIGSEDEENNYYSLGGDNHNDLDEDNS
jgi:hypothetical protein